jgi:undecaprenyl pyrophosphate phosphatase UppP
MLRLVLIVVCAIAGAIALYKLYQFIKTRQWDWTGLAFAVAFVVLAIWLRDATGTGGVLD